MAVPTEFRKFAKLFLQGSLEQSSDMKEFVARALRLTDSGMRSPITAYIDELLTAGLSENELHQIWISCSPNYWIDDGKMREFLSEIKVQLQSA